MNRGKRVVMLLLDQGIWLFLLVVVGVFTLLTDDFLTLTNLTNICVQASSTIVVATGMTFVLLAAGVDLSVGAAMFLTAAVAGKLASAEWPFAACLLAMLLVAISFALINAMLIAKWGIVPFVVTLGTLYIGRGAALWLTETRAINLPPDFLAVGTEKLVGIPLPVLVVLAVVGCSQVMLSYTSWGKHVLAVGYDRAAAEKAGVRTQTILLTVYLVSGVCAGLGALLALAQLGTVSPTFGLNREFTAIAAAVIGGTSLFGGRGSVFPGTMLGALLTQTVENGLVLLNADPYLYPLVMSGIIFAAVLCDGMRNRVLQAIQQRPIYRAEMVQ